MAGAGVQWEWAGSRGRGTQYSGPQGAGMGPMTCNSVPGYRGPQAVRVGSLPGSGVHGAKVELQLEWGS